MSPKTQRAARRDELLLRARRAIRGIDKGLAAIDAGDVDEFDQITSRLRMLVAPGQGNRLLFRVAELCSLPLGAIPVAIAPPHAPPEPLTFGMVNIPCGLEAVDLRVERVNLEDLMDRPALEIEPHYASDDRSTAPHELETYSWSELVRVVANKFGPSHADSNVPQIFDEIGRWAIVVKGPTSFTIHPAAYLLRELAVAVAGLGGRLLRDAGMDYPQVNHDPGVLGVWIGRLRFWGRLGGIVSSDVLAGHRDGTQVQFDLSWTKSGGHDWP